MFTEATYHQIKLFFKLTSKLASSLPFAYDEKACQVVEQSIRSKLWYILAIFWLVFRSFYHTFWILRGFLYGFSSVADTTIEISFAIFTSTVWILHVGAYCGRKTYMELLNQLLRVNQLYSDNLLTPETKTGGRHWNSGIRYDDGCWLYMKFLTPSFFSSSLTFGMMFLSQSHKRIYYYSYFVGADDSALYKGLYFLLECYTVYWMSGILYLLWYSQLLYANSTSFWLNQIT